MWPSIVVHGAYVCNLFMTKFSNVYLKKKKKENCFKETNFKNRLSPSNIMHLLYKEYYIYVNVNRHTCIINHNAHAQLQTNFSLCSTKSGREGKPIYLSKNKVKSSLKNMIISIKEQLQRVTPPSN